MFFSRKEIVKFAQTFHQIIVFQKFFLKLLTFQQLTIFLYIYISTIKYKANILNYKLRSILTQTLVFAFYFSS